MSSTFIVTGAAGFIGSHLCSELLRQGRRVVGIDNLDPFYDRQLKLENLTRLESPDFELCEADIRDGDAVGKLIKRVKPQGIFHFAALAGVRPSIQDPARYFSVNVDGLVTLLEAAREAGCGRVVFASSSSVYGNNAKVPFAESDPVDEPISPYAASKRAGELTCRVYSELFNMNIAAVRLFTVYGPAQRPDLAISKFMHRISADEEIPVFGDGTTSRDYTYIDDIIQGVLAANVRAAEATPGTFRIYNLGGSHPVTLSDMIASIGEVVGKQPQIRRLPMQPGDVQRTFADLSRSTAELGYRPQTSFVDGLKSQWQWMCGRLT